MTSSDYQIEFPKGLKSFFYSKNRSVRNSEVAFLYIVFENYCISMHTQCMLQETCAELAPATLNCSISGHADNVNLIHISRIILVYYCECCNWIGYSTRYLFIVG